MVAADGSRHRISHIGDMPLAARDRKGHMRRIILRNVRCVPSFTDTLISVDQLWEDSSVEARFANIAYAPYANQLKPDTVPWTSPSYDARDSFNGLCYRFAAPATATRLDRTKAHNASQQRSIEHALLLI